MLTKLREPIVVSRVKRNQSLLAIGQSRAYAHEDIVVKIEQQARRLATRAATVLAIGRARTQAIFSLAGPWIRTRDRDKRSALLGDTPPPTELDRKNPKAIS